MLSAVIIAKNEAGMISDCLASVSFAGEVIVVDNGSTDATSAISASLGAKIISSAAPDYAAVRNDGLAAARGDWILYVDADERVSPQLQAEITGIMVSPSGFSAFDLPRRNFYLGQEMNFGGWGGDSVIRLFRRSDLHRYVGKLHEQPEYSGVLGRTQSALLHYSHRDLESMLDKTLVFTAFEAKSRFSAHHPPVVWWRFFRIMLTEFWLRFIKLSAWRDGPRGVIDSLFQVFNSFIIYARLWELQQ